jgi:hypothetical protein
MRFFSLRDAVEVKVPTKDNGCLLYALTYDGAPKGRSKGDAAAMKALRKKVADFALQNRTTVFYEMMLEEWVKQTTDMDVKTWAAKFVDTKMMSDQMVLFIWPHIMGEAICVWRRCSDGYEHDDVYTFSSPDTGNGLCCRHVVYLPDKLHYNALQLVCPEKLKNGLMAKVLPKKPVLEIEAPAVVCALACHTPARCCDICFQPLPKSLIICVSAGGTAAFTCSGGQQALRYVREPMDYGGQERASESCA